MGIFNTTPAAAPPRNYAREYQKTLEAQLNNAGKVFSAEAQYQPLYNSLNLQNLNEFLNGTQAGSYDTYTYHPAVYKNIKAHSGGLGDLFGGFDPDLLGLGPDVKSGGGKKLVNKAYYEKTGTAQRAAQRGFLDIYQNSIMPSLDETQAASMTRQRTSDIQDVMKLGPQARDALRAANPDAVALLDQLNQQANQDLSLGTQLNPSEQRLAQQSSRGAWASRGLGGSPRAAFDEALQSLNYGRGLQDQRRNFAAQAYGMDQNFYGDPFEAILGRGSRTSGLAQNVSQQGEQFSKMNSLFNPESPYAADIYNTNFNAAQSRNNAAASNNAAILGSIISSVGSVAGGAAGFCWVAREVYGEDSPRWRTFRHWMLTRAPQALVELYREHGENIARWLKDNPTFKDKLRAGFESRIEELPLEEQAYAV